MLHTLRCRIADWLAIPLWVSAYLARHKTVRLIIYGIVFGMPFAYLALELISPGSGPMLFQGLMLVARLAIVLPFAVLQFVAIFWFMARTRTTEILPGDDKVVTFADYWGNEHIVRAVRDSVGVLVTGRKEFRQMGGRAVNGILLTGPPGTGKTWLAKCLAGSDGVAFYGMEASSLRAMFIGVDTMKVRGFFSRCRKRAREYGACIGYIDEIDAIAMNRGGVQGQGGQGGMGGGFMGGMFGMGAITRLLYELDGMGDASLMDQCRNRMRRHFRVPEIEPGKVMILASTNRPEALDPAITRSGRLDQKIHLGQPDRVSRRAIIDGYLATIRHDGQINVDAIVQDTSWSTPADIMAAITKNAVKRALARGSAAVSQYDIEMAFQEQALGLENPIRDLEQLQQWQIAIHEAGHALLSKLKRPRKRIARLSIIRRDQALGYMLPVDVTDVYTKPLREFVDDIMVSLAGHIATEIVLGEPWTGAAGDLQNIRGRVLYLAGHGFFGTYPLDLQPGPDLQKRVDKRLSEWYAECREVLIDNRAMLEALARLLAREGDLSSDRVERFFEDWRQGVWDETNIEQVVDAGPGGDPGRGVLACIGPG